MNTAVNDRIIELFVKDPLYKVNADGSIDTKYPIKGYCGDKERLLKNDWRPKYQDPKPYSNGTYMAIRYKEKHLWVHRIVYRVFHGPLDPRQEINHIDGNPSNNAAANIELLTGGRNLTHSYQSLGRKPNTAARNLTEDELRLLLADRALGMSLRLLANKYKISKTAASYIVNRKTYAIVEI